MPLLEDGAGLTFEYPPNADAEAEFLYEEIFVRRSYIAHGVCIPSTGAPVIIDAGANLGLFSLFALRENPHARIYAVEPASAAFACLERNLASAESSRCFQLLLRDRAGECDVHCYPDAPAESTCHPRERESQRIRLAAAAAAATAALQSDDDDADDDWAKQRKQPPPPLPAEIVRVAAVPLSDFLALHCGLADGCIDLLKVDVEGDELRLLRGLRAADWVRVRQVVVEVHDINGRLEACVGLLRRHGFSVHSEASRGGVVRGYEMVVPSSLRLCLVFATRRVASRSTKSDNGARGGAHKRKRKK